MKKFLEEFKAFALRGNVMDMAIGVIIGGAFTTIVTSLTENLINPILGLAGGTDLSGFVLSLGGIELRYGAFLTSVINFLIMALVLFCLLKVSTSCSPSERSPKRPPHRPRRGARSAAPKSRSQPSSAHTAPPTCRRTKNKILLTRPPFGAVFSMLPSRR